MSQGRSVFKMIMTNFIQSLKSRNFRGTEIGKDQFGTSYYEITATSNQRKARWFEPKDKDNHSQELPAEWESWLRYRRKEPPTSEEVLTNAELAKQKKINAAKLESLRPGTPSQQKTVASSFPKYDEYEVVPGNPPKREKDN